MANPTMEFLRSKRHQLICYTRERWADLLDRPVWFKYIVYAFLAYLFAMVLLGIWWSREPPLFSVAEITQVAMPETLQGTWVAGAATTATLIEVADTLLSKRGGYLSNDITPPGVWLDNIPSWEYGVLVQVRDLTRALREAFSRSQSQSAEDTALRRGEAQLNFSHRSWVLPATEDEYRRGIRALQDYQSRLLDESEQNAQFFTRADNLNYWLATVETRLGSLSQNLSASVGQRRLNTDLAGDPDARQSTRTPLDREVKTPWAQIDNVFFEARGSAWALLHFLRAVEIDFADVLEKKNARVSLQQIIRELEASQAPIRSPMILNGSGFGLRANHSLVMANYLSRANAALIDLRALLARG